MEEYVSLYSEYIDFLCVIFVKFKCCRVMLWLVKSLLHLYPHAHRHARDHGHVQLKKI
jgi:hypothetical protein